MGCILIFEIDEMTTRMQFRVAFEMSWTDSGLPIQGSCIERNDVSNRMRKIYVSL